MGVGWIIGEDGSRYRFHRDHMKPGDAASLGAPVEFVTNGKEANSISLLPPGTQVPIAPPRTPPAPPPTTRATGSQRPATVVRVSAGESERRKRIKNYFGDESALGAVISILMGLATITIGIGLLFIFFGIRAFVRMATRPSDQEVSAWTSSDVPDCVSRAIAVCSMGPTAMAPLEIRHAVAGELLGDASDLQRLGEDFEWRYSPQGVSVILLGDQQACVYQCAIDLTTGVVINERIYEFFYQDVVDIGWKHKTQTIDYRKLGFWGRQLIRATSGMSHGKEQRLVSDALRYAGRLREQYRHYVVDKVLQRNVFTTFVVTLDSGGAIEIPVFDGRPSAEASKGIGPDPNGARGLLEVARTFIREKKLILLGPVGARAPNAPVI